jgi:hypothetical protein
MVIGRLLRFYTQLVGNRYMRLASFENDYWQLRSGEKSHEANPDSFWIPVLTERQHLTRGQAARLIFDIETDDEGRIEVGGERMWVIVSEKIGDTYIGILDNQPACIDPDDNFYLGFGAEIPFKAEHVIDIDTPPQDYAEQVLSQAPEQRWLR